MMRGFMLGLEKYRYTVLATVSATALMVMVEQGALAADIVAPGQDRWWAAVEGQYLLFDGDSAFYGPNEDDPLGISLDPKDGWGIGGEVGFQPADSPWSFLARLRYGESNKEDGDASFYIASDEPPFSAGGTATADHREQHYIADLEIGRDVGLGTLGDDSNIRLFAGLRYAHFKGKGAVSSSGYSSGFYSGYGSADVDFKRTFSGIGPRIGFDAMVPLADQFALDVGAAGALLFGKQKLKISGSGTSSGVAFEVDEERSKSVVVPNLEASAALSWLVTENAKFSLGYRVDSYFEVYDVGAPFGDRDEGDRIIHGPFVKLTIGGGG